VGSVNQLALPLRFLMYLLKNIFKVKERINDFSYYVSLVSFVSHKGIKHTKGFVNEKGRDELVIRVITNNSGEKV
jgi:hypothetical protein